jgi:aldehyde:ferredoxin oxidoreductase
MAMVSKSPATGLWVGGTAGGDLAWALRQTPWDAVLLTGKASRLSYLLVDEGRTFFRSAEELKGRSCQETVQILRDLWGDRSSVLCIGPAGERQMRFAVAETGSLEGYVRGGMGAVLGAKNLKAIVVRPHVSVGVDKSQSFLDAVLPLIQGSSACRPSPFGGMASLDDLARWSQEGALPTRNFQRANVSDAWLDSLRLLQARRRSCPGCPAGCVAVVAPPEVPVLSVGAVPIPLVTEQLWALGPLLDLEDGGPSLSTVAACRERGMDPVSVGVLASWIAECGEKGIKLGVPGTEEAHFGSAPWLIDLPRAIMDDPGLGEFLREGVVGAAKRAGGVSRDFAMHFFGQELSLADPRRGYWPLSFLGPSASAFGEDPGGGSATPCSGRDSVKRQVVAEDRWALLETVGICGRIPIPWDQLQARLPELIALLTAQRFLSDEVFSWGQKCVKLIGDFNHREGWSPRDSGLPERIFREVLDHGGVIYPALDRQAWLSAVERYVHERGWSGENTG